MEYLRMLRLNFGLVKASAYKKVLSVSDGLYVSCLSTCFMFVLSGSSLSEVKSVARLSTLAWTFAFSSPRTSLLVASIGKMED